MAPIYIRLRYLAALLVAASGLAQAAVPWLAPVSRELLLTALCGCGYLLLALGLLGIGRLSLVLGMALPPLRAWFGLWPLPLADAELLRVAVDVTVAALSTVVLWQALHPEYRPLAPGQRHGPPGRGDA